MSAVSVLTELYAGHEVPADALRVAQAIDKNGRHGFSPADVDLETVALNDLTSFLDALGCFGGNLRPPKEIRKSVQELKKSDPFGAYPDLPASLPTPAGAASTPVVVPDEVPSPAQPDALARVNEADISSTDVRSGRSTVRSSCKPVVSKRGSTPVTTEPGVPKDQNEYMLRIWNDYQLTSVQKTILMGLSVEFGIQKSKSMTAYGDCRKEVSNTYLCGHAKIGESTARKNLRSLVDLGWLVRHDSGRGGRGVKGCGVYSPRLPH